jgi:hypothetical protein
MVYSSKVLVVLDLKSNMFVVLHLVGCFDTPKSVDVLPNLTLKIQFPETHQLHHGSKNQIQLSGHQQPKFHFAPQPVLFQLSFEK